MGVQTSIPAVIATLLLVYPVPDFNLRDQGGEYRSLDSLMGPNGIILMFHRSADW